MARIKFIILLIIFLLPISTKASSMPIEIDNAFNSSASNQKISPTTPQNVNFKQCCQKFSLASENLFYYTLASINANKFTIDEMQTKCGYILFTVSERQFLADVSKVDDKNSILKIIPCNNNYFFSPGIVSNVFKYIELNAANPIEKMN